jgi:hypothetical protein
MQPALAVLHMLWRWSYTCGLCVYDEQKSYKQSGDCVSCEQFAYPKAEWRSPLRLA